jgi:uncharacterized protein YyaL (SSP411 family)
LLSRFADPRHGGFYFVSDDHERLLTRSLSQYDGALPAGSGVAVELLLRLGLQLDEPRFRDAGQRALQAYRATVQRTPSAYAAMLLAADLAAGPLAEVAIVGGRDDPATVALLEAVHRRFRPRLAIACGEPAEPPGRSALLRGKKAIDGRPTAYVCRDYACLAPVHAPADLERQLGDPR